MTTYMFDMIKINRQHANVLIGPFVGGVLGFFITLSKTPPLIIRDTVYGAFLGLLATIAYILFEMSLAKYPMEESNSSEGGQGSQDGPDSESSEGSQEETEAEKATLQRIMDQLNELGQDRQRLMKARVAKKLEGPISMRTRSQIASLQ
jgi:hypothetical protein